MELPKETGSAQTVHGRWYGDACGTAFAMELIGERWSMLVLRELLLGPRRFSELRSHLPGISAKVLTERLAGLEQSGALRKTMLPPPANVQVYELTRWGYLAEPAMLELGRWAAMHPLHDATLPLSPVSLMLSLRTMVDRQGARGVSAAVGFDLAGDTYLARLSHGDLAIARGAIGDARAIFRAPSAPLLAAHIYGKVPLDDLAPQGAAIEGDRALAARFVDLFRLPEKVTG